MLLVDAFTPVFEHIPGIGPYLADELAWFVYHNSLLVLPLAAESLPFLPQTAAAPVVAPRGRRGAGGPGCTASRRRADPPSNRGAPTGSPKRRGSGGGPASASHHDAGAGSGTGPGDCCQCRGQRTSLVTSGLVTSGRPRRFPLLGGRLRHCSSI